MWGEGLREDQKFTTLVAREIERRTGRQVHLVGEPHCGAWMGDNPDGEDGPRLHGEIPSARPSIPLQARRVQDRDNVDLVLVNGGINDFGSLLVLLHPGLNITRFSTVAAEACGVMMRKLLAFILAEYPRAKVVVLGYYKIITSHSQLSELSELVKAVSKVNAPSGPIFWPAWLLIDFLTDAMVLTYREIVAPRLKLWHDLSRQNLSQAVEAQDSARVIYVDPDFTEANAYGAEDSLLFRLHEEDPMKALRREICSSIFDVGCVVAATGHPNEAGARQYARKILEGIDNFAHWMDQWRAPLRMQIKTDPQQITVCEPVKITASLYDTVTEEVVKGRIRVDEDPTDHEAGKEFEYTFQKERHTIRGLATGQGWNQHFVGQTVKVTVPQLIVTVIKPEKPIQFLQKVTVKLLVQNAQGQVVPARVHIHNGNAGPVGPGGILGTGAAGDQVETIESPPEGFDTTKDFEYVFRPFRPRIPRPGSRVPLPQTNPHPTPPHISVPGLGPGPGPVDPPEPPVDPVPEEPPLPRGIVTAPCYEDAKVEFTFG
ncbi:MAG: hypothetical protein M3441_04370 [Chloroflexota bacterium]|nr:hypothetical protein [Chloroflexota bacterium]